MITNIIELPELVIEISLFQNFYLIDACIKDIYYSELLDYEIGINMIELKFKRGPMLIIANDNNNRILYDSKYHELHIYNRTVYELAMSQIKEGILNLCKFTYKECALEL